MVEGPRAEGLLAVRPDRGAARRPRCLPGRAGDGGRHVTLGLRRDPPDLTDPGWAVPHGDRASRPGGAKTPQGPIYLGYPERGGRGGGRDDVPRNAPLPDARRGPHVSFAAMLSAHALYLSLDSFNILGT